MSGEAQGEKPRDRTRARRVTIADVADAVGLTKGTVSRALNGYPDISERTQKRVSKAADLLGYRALSQAQAIRTGRVRAVAIVLQLSDQNRQRPFLADFLSGVSEAATAKDWSLTLATATSDAHAMALMSELWDQRKADGFILARTYVDDPRVAFLRESGIPFVLYGRTNDMRGAAWLDVASETSMAEAVGTLAGLNHRRIGFVPGGAQFMYSKLRHEGYRNGLANAGLPYDPTLVGPPALTRAEGTHSAARLLDLDDRPTALVCATDTAAIGAYVAARERGLEIGTDLSIIGYEGLPESEILSPPLSTFKVDSRHAGAMLTDFLIRRITGAAISDLRALIGASFESRASHGPAKQTPAKGAVRISKTRRFGRTK